MSVFTQSALSRILVLIPLLCIFLAVGLCHGSIILVPADQLTIQAGIDAAVDGDTVMVADGTYTGDGNRDINFLGKAITVMSENGPETCIIDCEGTEGMNHRGFRFNNQESETSVLNGLSIQNGDTHDLAEGGGILCWGSSPTITNCNLSYNRSKYRGGGIACSESASPTISNCIISHNMAYPVGGGGIYCQNNSNPLITNCIITNQNSGGGIQIYESSPTIVGCTISMNNRGGIDIGGVDSSPEIIDCIITNNNRSGDFGRGGGVLITYCSNLGPVLQNCIISENSSSHAGGGIAIRCLNSKTYLLQDCVISGNTTEGNGGGLYIGRTADTIVNRCVIENNTAENGGGVYTDSESKMLLDHCSIIGNTAENNGGGIYNTGIESVIYSSLISGNVAQWGGGIWSETLGNPLSVIDSKIYVNQAVFDGGGLWCRNTPSQLMDSEIMFNTVSNDGGGILCHINAPTLITNCILSDNNADHTGGGILCWDNSPPELSNCTLSRNQSGSTGGISCVFESAPIITNCIVWNNANEEVFDDSGNAQITYSDIQGGFPGEGNVNMDPLFNSGPLGDFYLSHIDAGQDENSPCINSGSDLASIICFTTPEGEKCLDEFTTRTDQGCEIDSVDMGFHYGDCVFIPTPTPTPTIIPTSTPICDETGVNLWMTSHEFSPGDPCVCHASVCNLTGSIIEGYPLFVVLDIFGSYFWGPDFTETFDSYLDEYQTFPEGTTEITVIPSFTWPDTGTSANGILFIAALTTPEISDIFGEMDTFEFGWGM